MNVRKVFVLSMTILVLCAPGIQASDINWSGFLSTGVGTTLDEDTRFVVDPITGAAYGDDITFAPESIVALQAQTAISDKMRATVQLVAKGGDDYNAHVELAFLSYALTDNLTANAGRFRLPLYFYSDFLDVGYAYHWARPPTDVYDIPQSSLDGVNLRHITYLGASDVELETQIWYGARDLDIGQEDPLEMRANWGIAPLLTWEWLKFRLVYNSVEISFGPEPAEITYTAAAFMADYNNFIWRSEITQRDNMGVIFNAWYGSIGYQVGNFTPHITLAGNDSDPSINLGSFDPITGPTEMIAPKHDSVIAGVRWDFHTSSALKLEYTMSTLENEFTSLATGDITITENDVSLLSLTLDIIF